MRSHKDLDKVWLGGAAHLEDTQIAAAIADVLSRNGLPPDAVWATIAAGRVTLKGKVERWSQRDAIERAMQGINGIRDVTNLLTVKPEAISQEVQRAVFEARASPW